MGKIISFANQKGGVGKTTSAVNVAASLGLLGSRVLLVDLDPQGNATSGVGIMKKDLKGTTRELLLGDVSPENAVHETEFTNLWVVPANTSLAGAEFDLFDFDESVYRLRGKENIVIKIYREISPMSQDTVIKLLKCMK